MAKLVMVAWILGLTAVLLAGCGGGGDRAKVEASLHDYLVSLVPEDGPFPIGAGTARVKENGCKDRHVKDGMGLAVWAYVVKFGTLAMPVVVAVDDSTEVVAALPGALPGVFNQFKPK
jgi:hypothetical protein